jgi:hypothetical protein
VRIRRRGKAQPVVVLPRSPLERLEDRLADLGPKLNGIAEAVGDTAALIREMAQQMTRRAGESSDECGRD